MSSIKSLINFIAQNNTENDKSRLAQLVATNFSLTKDRSVYYCDTFAIRFSSAEKQSFSNTVLSLSALQKYDERPFIVCVSTPGENYLLLSNTTLLKKISHSSQELRVNNIKGSFNGSDILRELNGIPNSPENFDRLFQIHATIGFEENLTRLVEATNNIAPSGKKFIPTEEQKSIILDSPIRASSFIASQDFNTLKSELDQRVEKYQNEIILASLIENVNVRGRAIEYIIAGRDDALRTEIIRYIKNRDHRIPAFKTENNLGDYSREFPSFQTETDVKTKIMILDSNPKAYNIDKILDFLSHNKSVFMFYFVGVTPTEIVNTVLTSMFQEELLKSTILLKHWAGRNSRGVTQFEGKTISRLIEGFSPSINQSDAKLFLAELLGL